MTATLEGDRAAALSPRSGRRWPSVRDPELDEPVTELGFVASCRVSPAGEARVRLRLPTYFCAPNFAFLMVADAHAAVGAVPGVTHTAVTLDDHFAADEINGGVAAEAGFVRTFDGLAQLRAGRAPGGLPAQGRAGRHRPGVPPPAGEPAAAPRSWPT